MTDNKLRDFVVTFWLTEDAKRAFGTNKVYRHTKQYSSNDVTVDKANELFPDSMYTHYIVDEMLKPGDYITIYYEKAAREGVFAGNILGRIGSINLKDGIINVNFLYNDKYPDKIDFPYVEEFNLGGECRNDFKFYHCHDVKPELIDQYERTFQILHSERNEVLAALGAEPSRYPCSKKIMLSADAIHQIYQIVKSNQKAN